ncbi:hypothetical protein CB7_239 [Pectobacterium phage vB_PatM_CB7]|uniref:Uncharacterized protein n=1 Tax=Pectobacterium phage phiTE TaxID=1116482 RepID=K9L531_9CAUD|nr:hypothetical protein phiTE_190 [Pectobacterium phage phiTE]AEZ66356.1 hypothetical protein phiTE_190 [Pectobacterium phage phiTE]ARB11692.1 hypothetical protein CB7_239 [Pectobacterium phage vB_PatM_CB7]
MKPCLDQGRGEKKEERWARKNPLLAVDLYHEKRGGRWD